MAVSISGPKFYAWDNDTGDPLAFGKVYTYISGTNTPKPTYESENGEVENPNPVILNASGYAAIYLIGTYKIIVKDADDVVVWTADPVSDTGRILEQWLHEQSATRVGPDEFKISGNVTDLYLVDRAVKLEDSITLYGNITSVFYQSGETFVTVDIDQPLTGDLSRSWVGIVVPNSLPTVRVETATGQQKLADALDSRVIYGDDVATISGLQNLDEGQYANIEGSTFRWDGASMKPVGSTSVKAYGAEGDGSTNDDLAIQNAMDDLKSQGGGVLYFPPGTYRINTRLISTTSLVSFEGSGSSSSIINANGVDALAIDSSGFGDRERVFVSHMGFETTANGGNTAIDFTGKTGSALGAQLTVTQCSFSGQSNSNAWDTPIHLRNAKFTEVLSCYFRGNTSDVTSTNTSILMDTCTDTKILNNYFYWCNVGIDITGFSEGLYITGSHFVPVNRGVRHAGTGNLVWVTDCHISANLTAITFGSPGVNAVNHSHATSNLIFKRSTSTNNFVAIQSYSNRNTIIGNEVLIPGGSSTSGSQTGIVVYSGSSHSRVVGNQLANMDTGIFFQNSTSDHTLVGNTYLACNTNYIIEGENITSGTVFSGDMVRLTAVQTIPNETLRRISWDSAIRNTPGFWDGTDPSKLGVPNGVSQVRLRCAVQWETEGQGERFVEIQKNGNAAAIGLAATRIEASAGSQVQLSTAVMDVNPADYFEVYVRHNIGGPLDVRPEAQTWFEIETIA